MKLTIKYLPTCENLSRHVLVNFEFTNEKKSHFKKFFVDKFLSMNNKTLKSAYYQLKKWQDPIQDAFIPTLQF